MNQMNLLWRTWLAFIIGILCANCWDLSSLKYEGHNYGQSVIEHVTVYYLRAFLCIQSRLNSSTSTATLIESTWPENLMPFKPRIFPNELAHARSVSDCNGILHAISTTVDNNGYLWVLDNGSIYCHPKVIVYNLLRRNEEIHRYTFGEFRGGSFRSIQVQSVHEIITDNLSSTKAFICLQNANFLIQYSFADKSYTKLTFNIRVVFPKDILIKHENHLIIVDTGNRLWLGNLNRIKSRQKNRLHKEISVNHLGTLLGLTDSIAVTTNNESGNLINYIYYYLPKDGAIVRWNSRLPLIAEGHDVVYLTSVPVTQIIIGAKGSVWIVRKTPDAIGDHCTRILNAHS